jgi:hypothetical protein
MSIFNDISSQIGQLLALPEFKVKFHKLSLVPQSEIDDVREVLNSVLKIRCPPAIASSVEIDDQLNVYWNAEGGAGGDMVFGEFFLRSVLLFGKRNELNSTFLSKEYNGVDLRKTRVFDYYAYNGGPIYALFPVVENVIEDRVLIFNEKQVSRTSLDYMRYLQLVRRTRGFMFWQYLFCERIDLEEYELAAIQRGLAFIERKFPTESYSDLKQHLARLETRR